jgi:hypothetical protein
VLCLVVAGERYKAWVRRSAAANRVAGLAAIENVRTQFSLRPLQIHDPIEAFPPSSVTTSDQIRYTYKDQKMRKSASCVGWHGQSDDGVPFDLYYPNRLDVSSENTTVGRVTEVTQYQVVKIPLSGADLGTDRLAIFPLPIAGGIQIYTERPYNQVKFPSKDSVNLKFDRKRMWYTIRCPRGADQERLHRVFRAEVLDWLESLSVWNVASDIRHLRGSAIRFEITDGSLCAFQFVVRREECGDVAELIRAAMRMVAFIGDAPAGVS